MIQIKFTEPEWYLQWVFTEKDKFVVNLKKDKKLLEKEDEIIFKHIGKNKKEHIYLLNSKGISPLT